MEIHLYNHCKSNKYDSLYQIQDSELDKSTVLPLGLSLCLCHTQCHKKWGVDYSFLMPQMQTMLSSAFQSSNSNVGTLRIFYSELICTFLESVSENVTTGDTFVSDHAISVTLQLVAAFLPF